jgi:hypothetical protein
MNMRARRASGIPEICGWREMVADPGLDGQGAPAVVISMLHETAEHMNHAAS